jgi:hypothetical protein
MQVHNVVSCVPLWRLSLSFRDISTEQRGPFVHSSDKDADVGSSGYVTSLERVSCFTSFDPVPEKTFVHHNWYYKDKLSTRIKLSLQPPRWSTFSSIQLREADKGPWRIEIADEKGDIFRVLRFSITD